MSARATCLVACLVAAGCVVACSATPGSDGPLEAAGENGITGIIWEWTSTSTPVEVVDVGEPDKYTMVLGPDGQAQIQADCNRATATYTIEGNSINIGPMAMTLMECGPESLSDRYAQDLSAAAVVFVEDGDLFLDLRADGGTMRFVSAGAAQ